MGNLSKNFDWEEFEYSAHGTQMGLHNAITSAAVRDSLKALVNTVLQPLRDALGEPLNINSGYRSPALNAAVGGVPTSQHTKGEAADVASADPHALAALAKRLGLPYDQMILYPTFVHFSHRREGDQRGAVLYNRRYNGPRDI